ncbi:MAG TPA: hypothetical protein PL048_18250 [Leptospiraceae bacterium]|nr:hypothetical protein [Leptospiraceae bacterium]HNF27794.1 hypothetical protein [Leptospiraceae bacterium]
MDRRKILCIGIILISATIQTFAEGEDTAEPPALPSPSEWSPFQGTLNWSDASERCQSLGMRLPTVEEAQSGLSSGKLKRWDWRYDGMYHYWTSSDLGDLHGYIFEVHSGRTEPRFKKQLFGVRCIRLEGFSR